jgi:hypothetical protein
MANLSGFRARLVVASTPAGGVDAATAARTDSPAALAAEVRFAAGARARVVHAPAGGNRGDQLVVGAHGDGGKRTDSRDTKKRNPGRHVPAGVGLPAGPCARRRFVEGAAQGSSEARVFFGLRCMMGGIVQHLESRCNKRGYFGISRNVRRPPAGARRSPGHAPRSSRRRSPRIRPGARGCRARSARRSAPRARRGSRRRRC